MSVSWLQFTGSTLPPPSRVNPPFTLTPQASFKNTHFTMSRPCLSSSPSVTPLLQDPVLVLPDPESLQGSPCKTPPLSPVCPAPQPPPQAPPHHGPAPASLCSLSPTQPVPQTPGERPWEALCTLASPTCLPTLGLWGASSRGRAALVTTAFSGSGPSRTPSKVQPPCPLQPWSAP